MKKMIVAVLAVAVFAVPAFAADVIEMKKGVSFNHKAHGEALKDCTKCHEKADGGKIAGFGKDLAHKKVCKDCHTEMKKGPTNCKGCHTK
jgi:cytochrome c553